jgi:hypothetical protein
VALGGPEPYDGVDDEPDEPEFDDEPEFEDEPELDEEPEPEDEVPEPDDDAPEPDDVAECPVPLWAAELLVLLCAAAGSSAITTPATATPTIPAPMVALRRRRRAWSRAKIADTVRSSLCILEAPLGQATPIVSVPVI